MTIRILTPQERTVLLPEIEQLKRLFRKYNHQRERVERIATAVLPSGSVLDIDDLMVKEVPDQNGDKE